jgi:hypothetical protein
LPIRYLHADIEIATGGHSMVLDHAREITEILRRIVRAEDALIALDLPGVSYSWKEMSAHKIK